jgi:adenosylcobinamide kinase/adenosylcobinamide-phosphate guanylyltransferase
MTSQLTLVLGGARSGKSSRALSLAETQRAEAGARLVFIATAEAGDDEMVRRIAAHRAGRPAHWTIVEEPLALARALKDHAQADSAVVVDCLTLWLSNLLLAERDLEAETAALESALADAKGSVWLVSNEVGLGLVPETPLGRSFRDAQGRLNQRMAACADRVEFVAAGLPLVLKG